MANTNTDLTEEDAADLQFPKEDKLTTGTLFSNFKNDNNGHLTDVENLCCINCAVDLVTPFILCDICKVNICCVCFSNGVEFLNHKNDHSYRVLYDNFCLFENSDWTAKEEVTLLESALKYGNWDTIAKQFPKWTVKEVKEHYDYFYLERHGSDSLPKVQPSDAALFPEPLVPYRFRIANTEDPPRYLPHHVGYQALSGYNAARSDFEVEYDRSAEDLMVNLQEIDPQDPAYDLKTDLQCAIVNTYNRRLMQRQWRKEVIRNHGLISYRKMAAWLHRYDITITRPVYSKLLRFMQFYNGMDFESLLEGLHRAGEIKYRIYRLLSFRSKGITSLADAKLYLHLQQLHDKNQKELRAFQSDPRLNWRSANQNSSHTFPLSKRRSGYTPIDIVGMPGYEKLSQKERELCKNVRLVPISYIEFKNTLIVESKKMGYLKLQTARKLLKIDVNKTRRLYDFLVEEGYIEKPVS